MGSRFEVELPFDAAPPDAALPPSRFLDLGLPWRPSGRLPGVRLLVADDSEVNLEVARRILEREGATVTLADHGLQAVERVRAAPQAVDLVLMDAQMPVLDGLSATRALHALPGCDDLPVLALTAGALSSEQHRAEQAGMLGFVTKPFDPNELVLAVLRHLRQPPELSTPHAAAGPWEDLGATPSTQAVAAADWPALDGIDRVDVHARLGGDLALFRKLLRRLLASVEGFDGVALVADGLDGAAARLHHLRGTASLLGAYTVQALCADAEAACRAGHADLAGTLARRIGPALAQLRRGSDAFLSQPDPWTAGSGALDAPGGPVAATAAASARSHGLAGPVDATLPSAALQGLLDALGSQRLDALDRFDTLAPALKAALGAAPFERLRDAIDQLQFAPAAAQLEAFIAGEAATSS